MRFFTLKWSRVADGLRASNGHWHDRFPAFSDLRPLFERELRRARRHDRPVTVVIFNAVPAAESTRGRNHNGLWKGGVQLDFVTSEPGSQGESSTHLGDLLSKSIRETDLFAFIAETNVFVVLLPEVDETSAEHAIARIRQQWPAVASATLEIGRASFPLDALVLDELLNVAHRARSIAPMKVEQSGDTRDAANG